MNIYISRHGQTNLNLAKKMQGQIDEPLNETGIAQAEEMHRKLSDVHFDAVYSSPLNRAIHTASILAGVDQDEIIIDERITEVGFGKYEYVDYDKLGLAMTLFWMLPEVIPAPKTVEPVKSFVKRSHSFLKELEQKDYENVLVVCHGGIIRALKGYLSDKKNGIVWRPRPTNCEIRVFESIEGKHRFLETFSLED